LRQYWGSKDENGHVYVHITLYSSSLLKENINFKDDIVEICDGGCSILNVIVDLETGLITITSNGLA